MNGENVIKIKNGIFFFSVSPLLHYKLQFMHVNQPKKNSNLLKQVQENSAHSANARKLAAGLLGIPYNPLSQQSYSHSQQSHSHSQQSHSHSQRSHSHSSSTHNPYAYTSSSQPQVATSRRHRAPVSQSSPNYSPVPMPISKDPPAQRSSLSNAENKMETTEEEKDGAIEEADKEDGEMEDQDEDEDMEDDEDEDQENNTKDLRDESVESCKILEERSWIQGKGSEKAPSEQYFQDMKILVMGHFVNKDVTSCERAIEHYGGESAVANDDSPIDVIVIGIGPLMDQSWTSPMFKQASQKVSVVFVRKRLCKNLSFVWTVQEMGVRIMDMGYHP